ncbi:MAG: hypothetical protein ACK4NR_09150 [Micavibrio sp.]
MLHRLKTFIFAGALFLLGALQYDPVIQFIQNNTGLSLQIIAGIVVALRFITTQPIFKGLSGGSENGSAGLVVLLWVVLGGLAGNSYLAAEAGRPVKTAGDVKTAIEKSVETRKSDWSHLNR